MPTSRTEKAELERADADERGLEPRPGLEAGLSTGADGEMRLVIGLDAARIAEICGRAAGQIQAADRLLDAGQIEEALRIYRGEVLPLYHALAKLPPRGVLMHKIAEAMARRGEGGGAG